MKRDLINFEPKSIFFDTYSKYSRYQERLFYLQMFLEDTSNSIIPRGGSRYSGKPFSVSISPNEQLYRNNIKLLFPSKFRSNERLYSTIEETVSDFIGDCAKRLVVHGTQYYEIVPASINSEKIKGNLNLSEPLFAIVNISERVHKLGNIYLQFIPRNLWKKANKKLVILPASSVWQISIPRKIGGTRSTGEMLRGLFVAGGNHQALMTMFDESISKKRAFDVNLYSKNVESFVAWRTKSWGWDVRSSLQRYSLEYYKIYRRIMSAYTLAIFREHIFDEMNSLLSRIGYGCQMKMDGLPASSTISEIFSKLENKEISLTEAYDLTNIH